MRLGLSATAAAAVLYGAVVLLGLGPASPGAALGTNDDDVYTPVVRSAHDSVVIGPALRLPQVSAGPVRHRRRHTNHIGTVGDSTPPKLGTSRADTAEPAPSPQQPEPPPSAPRPTSLPPAAAPVATLTVPTVVVPAVPATPALLPATLPPSPTLPSVSLP